MAFINVEVYSYACFLESFCHKSVLNFVKGFPFIYWDNHMVFIFQFVNSVYHIDWLWILKNPCTPRIKPLSIWCMIFLTCSWILFARILLRSFASMFISNIAYNFLFWWHRCLVLVLGWWWPHVMNLEIYILLQFSGSLSRTGINLP